MFAWLKRSGERADPQRAQVLLEAVRGALGDEDEDLIRIVACVAALMLCVAYADMDVREEELAQARRTLSRVQGLDESGVDVIVEVLRQHTVTIAAPEATTYARELLQLTEEDFRLELLDALVDIAAADDEISLAETNMLRGIARSLGLTQAQYNRSQTRHKERLAVLRS